MAKLVTKRYKKEAHYEFLRSRRQAWNRLFTILIIFALLEYPTPILGKLKQINILSTEQIQKLDSWILTLFYFGIYTEKSDLALIGNLLLGLMIERVAINWLKNRFGCTHFKLQKFAELDQRREAERHNWDIVNPKYDVENYRQHYFRNDFDDIKELVVHMNYKDLLKTR